MAEITIFRNAFSDECEHISINTRTSIKDVVKFNHEYSHVFVNGFLRNPEWVIDGSDVCLIREYPSDPVTVFSVLCVAAAVYAVADNVVEALTGKNLLEHIAQGLFDMLGTDEVSDTESLAKIPQLRGARNQVGLDKPVPLVLGTHLYTPYYCGSPYTCIDPTDGSDGENQYFVGLYMLGYSGLKVKDLKIGELNLASNTEGVMNGSINPDGLYSSTEYKTQIEIQQSSEVSLYTQKVIEEQLSIELFNVADTGLKTTPIRFSAQCAQKVEVEILINGLIGYSSKGKKEYREVRVKAEYRPLGGDDSSWVKFGPFLNNSYFDSSTGVSSFWRQKNKQMRFVATLDLNFTYIQNCPSNIIEIRITRENAQGTDGRTTDTVYWSAIRTWCYDLEKSTSAVTFVPQVPVVDKLRAKTTRLGFKIRASSELTGTIGAVNMIVSSIARIWDGVSWSNLGTVTSRNPASLCLLALQQKSIGDTSYLDSELDLDSFGELYDFCEEKEFTCDGIVTTTKKLETVVETILNTCRSQLIIKDGKYAPLIDKPRSYPVTVLNQQNTLSATNTKTFDELPGGLRISFVDANDGYQTNEICVMYDGVSEDDPDVIFSNIELPFVTSAKQAYKIGRYTLACLKLRPEVWTRKVSLEGYGIPIGSLVSVQDDTICVGSNEGGYIDVLLTDGTNVVGIICDSYFDMLNGNTYGVKIVQSDGISTPSVRTCQVVTVEGYTNRFTFVEPIPLNSVIIPSPGDLVGFGLYEKITTDAIVVGRTPSDDQTFELTLIPYDEGIYTADTGIIPEFDSKVTKPLPIASTESMARKYATFEELIDAVETITVGSTDTVPDSITSVSAIASKDGITITWPWDGSGLENALKRFRVEISDDGFVTWRTIYVTTNRCVYAFSRDDDGYPEAAELAPWRVRVKAENMYSKESDFYGPSSSGQPVDVTGYIGWNPITPSVGTTENGRGPTIGWSDSAQWYGIGAHDIQIAKGYSVVGGVPDLITDLGTLVAYAPALGLNPKSSYDNYKTGGTNGYLTRDGATLALSLPLYGQNETDSVCYDTPYYIRVRSSSDVPTTADPTARLTSGWSAWNLVYARGTVQDLVQNAIKNGHISDYSITANKILVEMLSAICANVGVITDGAFAGSANNYWALSRVYDTDGITVLYYEGAMRVGGTNQYLKVTPVVVGGVVTDYTIDFKVGTFTVTATGSTINGDFVVKSLDGATTWMSINQTTGAVQINSTLNVTGLITGNITTAARIGVAACVTAQATVAKVATLAGFTLVAGAKVSVKFTYASVASATLNVNETGAKTIYYDGAVASATSWSAGDIVEFIYDGTYFHIVSLKKASLAAEPEFAGNALSSNVATQVGVGSCDTAAATAAKVVVLPNFVLFEGARVSVKFTYASCASATLNVNGTGSKVIISGNIGTTINTWAAGDVVEFIYVNDKWTANLGKDHSYSQSDLDLLFYGTAACSLSEKALVCTDTSPATILSVNSGSIISGPPKTFLVLFKNMSVPAGASLRVNGDDPRLLYVNGAPIKAGVIPSGATARIADTGGLIYRVEAVFPGDDTYAPYFCGNLNSQYAVRAWVVFNGLTNTITSSANIASIENQGGGNFKITFTTAMPNANYFVAQGVQADSLWGTVLRSSGGGTNSTLFGKTTTYYIFQAVINYGQSGTAMNDMSVAFIG